MPKARLDSAWWGEPEFAGIGPHTLALWWALISYSNLHQQDSVGVGVMADLCRRLGIDLQAALPGLYAAGLAELDAERQTIHVNGCKPPIVAVGRSGLLPVREAAETCSPAEVASRLGVHVSTVYDRLHRGEIKGIRMGRKWLVPRAALDQMLGAID